MRRPSILIVEDEPLIAMELEDRLGEMGYAVVGTASNGEAALRLVEDVRPDLVLMDIHLQGALDGIELAETLGARFNTPVVYLTAHADEATLARARRTEPLGYVVKPFRPQDLRATIEMAVHKHRADAELKRQVMIDSLTGLYNRRFLDEMLPRECSRARRSGTPLSVAMVDLDRFKLVNDQYGHEAGDHALKTVAAEILTPLRKSDLVCRYGGEEFVLLLPDTPLDAAVHNAERVCAHVRSTTIVYKEATLKVTLSAGVATMSDHAAGPAELLRAADGALYRAKQSGRDRVCVARDVGLSSRPGTA